ncbi:phosphogluconate dehydratase [Ramlibacter sp. RBP-2]|uniref:Phosphogluconate dehydratase n=1 Tax=Ramlibacter lithotrophicus TaxID=2606681 RepID=A0A7X6DHZ4_9BURK|nr:dihydroxy-acid dehydratase [Ramlibacter lithotrophicus]NKE67535.1 phosphogluconate dehydratase [Ramlibacter lithotrophicus]
MSLHPVVARVTERMRQRSAATRGDYLQRVDAAAARERSADRMGCANVAHAFAALPGRDKFRVVAERVPNIGIVTSYNDMLSAHAPFASYPDIIKDEARQRGATAQVAGGVPAMCDGVTQGLPGMELSLFSRDVIAQATAVALSHDVFDAALLLGICDKIVPGLMIGVLHFGHLPAVFVPGGPMASGLSNSEKAKVREQAAQGLVGRAELLGAESRAYHSPGTCTFYGTANSNQMLMEAMGLHVPGTAFVNPGGELREQLTREAVRTALSIAKGRRHTPVGRLVDERAIVNAMAALLATGGSTNHLIHWVAVARAAGITIDWDDFAQLSAVVPLLARVYPNGSADVNQFQAAGGPGFVIRELLDAGLMHEDVLTVREGGIREFTCEPALAPALTPALSQGEREQHGQGRSAPPSPTEGEEHGQGRSLPPPLGEGGGGGIVWHDIGPSRDPQVVRPTSEPFSRTGGLKLLTGNLGRSVIKVSAVPADRHLVEAPARVFDGQEALLAAFKAGELECDVVCVVRWQGPRANGMPELHKLTPPLAVLQGRGFRVALVTDGRMSGASGKVPAAIHVCPEASAGGPLAKLRDGDVVRLDADAGVLQALVTDAEWSAREAATMPQALRQADGHGTGRELFASFRRNALSAEEGACTWL